MKRISLTLIAAASCVLFIAAARPRYGGTLRIEFRESLEKFSAPAANSRARDWIAEAVCDRLVTMDATGHLQPALATSWSSERDARTWRFSIRQGVQMHNGEPLSPQTVVTVLSQLHPDWQLRASERDVVVESTAPHSALPAELAEIENSVCVQSEDARLIGSGAFSMTSFEPGRAVELHAFESSWQGRPFVDKITVALAKSNSEETNDLQAGTADLIEGDPAQQSAPGMLIAKTQPDELIALSFSANPAVREIAVRSRIGAAIDRQSIATVILRHAGVPAQSLLPEWVSGYSSLFQPAVPASGSAAIPQLTIGYDLRDPQLRLIAERIVVNARQAGIAMQARPAAGADMRVVRIHIDSAEPANALAALPNLHVDADKRGSDSATAQYALESDALAQFWLVPIAHVPEAFAFSVRVHDFVPTPWGELRLADVWVEGKP